MRLLCKELQGANFILFLSKRVFGLLHFPLFHCYSHANKYPKLTHHSFFLMLHKNTEILQKKTWPKSLYGVIFGFKNWRISFKNSPRGRKDTSTSLPNLPWGSKSLHWNTARSARLADEGGQVLLDCVQHVGKCVVFITVFSLTPYPVYYAIFKKSYQHNRVKCTLICLWL